MGSKWNSLNSINGVWWRQPSRMTTISKRSVSSCSADTSHNGLEASILWTTVTGQTRKTKLSEADDASVWTSSGDWHSGITSPSFVSLTHADFAVTIRFTKQTMCLHRRHSAIHDAHQLVRLGKTRCHSMTVVTLEPNFEVTGVAGVVISGRNGDMLGAILW